MSQPRTHGGSSHKPTSRGSSQPSDSSTLSAGTAETYATYVNRNEPPSLHYTLRTPQRVRYIALFFTLVFIESGVLPLILFYSLEWGAHLSMQTNLAIITSLVGTVSGFKLGQRTWMLWFRDGYESRRPIGGGKWGVDTFHIWITIALTGFFVPLIIGSSLSPASPRAVAMALPFFMLCFCIPLGLTGIWDGYFRVPFHVSSLPAYQSLPPLTYTIVEDVVSVDGGGRLAFRQAWRHRYEVSRVMRRLLRVTAIVWGTSGCIMAGGLIIAAWTAPVDTAYGLGFGISWLWAFVLIAWTLRYVHNELVVETQDWQGGAREAATLFVNEKQIDRQVDHLQQVRDITGARVGTEELERMVREGRLKKPHGFARFLPTRRMSTSNGNRESSSAGGKISRAFEKLEDRLPIGGRKREDAV